MRIRSTSLAVFAAVPLVLTGCSEGAQSGPAQSPPPPQAPPAASPQSVAWADQLCGLVGGFQTSQKQGPGVDKSSAQAFKDSSVAQIDRAEKSAGETVGKLQAMPPSPIRGGDQVRDTFAVGFGQVRDLLGSARTKAEQVDISNQQAFVGGVTAVQQELKKGQSLSFGPQFAELDRNKELNAAAGQATSCKQLTAPAPQPGQPAPPR
jgi:hypothetical protein